MLVIQWSYIKNIAVVSLILTVAVISFVLFTTKDTHAALAKPPYSTAGINAKLYGGVQQAINWDKECYDGLVQKRQDSSLTPRQIVNEAPSYKGEQWLSLADTPTQNNSSRTAPIVVSYGTKSVPLQLNMIKFICAALVSPDGAGAYFPYTDKRVVRFLNNANERSPNSLCGTNGVGATNCPALTDSRFRIDNINVVQGNGHITGAAVGKYIGTARQDNTRYWFANPVGFNFVSNSPNGITSTTEVKIKFTLRGYNTYYYDVYQCYRNNTYTYPPDSLNINVCGQNVVTLSIMINVRGNYNLTPAVNLNGQTSIAAGGTATVQNTVALSVGGTNSDSTDWRLTELDYSPGTALAAADLAARDSASDPCGSFTTNGRVACNTSQRNGNMIFNSPQTTFNPQYTYAAPASLPAGTKVCFIASVSKPTPADIPLWRHSAMTCLMTSKRPKVQIWGGDVAVRGMIETSTDIKAGKTFGSWVEYGAFSTDINKRFASGSGLNNGQPNDNQVAWSSLTFANKDDVGVDAFGQYTTSTNFRPIVDVAGYFGSALNRQAISGTSVDLASLTYSSSSPVVVHTANDLRITAGDIPAGKSVVIVASGTVTIDHDINYTNAMLNTVKDIPQVVIIAKNINITNNVKNIDAWLVTSGTTNTCSDFVGNLTIAKCNNPLVVNGPVITNRLLLNRTAGNDVGDPAERFNLRPDVYLWAQLQASGSSKAQTVYSTELSPRF